MLSLILLALSIVRIVAGVPLGIEYDKTTGLTPQETANKGRLDTATTLANAQVAKMREGLDKYKAGDAKATALYNAAFGKNADVNVVDKTVTALQNNNIKAKLATHPFTQGEIAAVPWSKSGKNPWTAGPAQFSDQFHGGGTQPLNDEGRAGTLIHEATHQLAKTGDDINLSGKVIKANDGSSKASGNTGYTSNHNMHKTLADVKADKAFTDVRDAAPNMHDNAESYAVFASLCSQPGALRRRDVRLYNRAMLASDHEQLHYLARRNSCQLPPDYFAKKAAAKKAAAAKAASGDVKAATGSKLAATHGTKASTKDSKSVVRPTVKAPRGAKAATKGASAARLTKIATSKSPSGAKVSKASLRGNRLATKGARTAIKGAKALTTARTAKGSTKAAKAGRLLQKTTAKGSNRLARISKTALKAKKQAPKGNSRTVKGTKALTRVAKAAKSNKQRTQALKSPHVNSHTSKATLRGSSKVTAARHVKAAHSVKSPQVHSHVKAVATRNSSKVGAAHAARPVVNKPANKPAAPPVKPLSAKVAVPVKSRKH